MLFTGIKGFGIVGVVAITLLAHGVCQAGAAIRFSVVKISFL